MSKLVSEKTEYLGDGLDRDFDLQNNDVSQSEIASQENAIQQEVIEGLFPSGLYFKEEDGTQGIAPRCQDSNSFKLTDEEIAKKELLTRKLIDAHPSVSEGVIDFACSFWMKHPEEFKKIIKESKGTESKSIKQIQEMKNKYGRPEEENWNSPYFNIEKLLENNNDTINFENIKI